ncbi:type II toxin-antitoxin system YafQ family toxin [Fusobacterium polymorphum]|uniref:type II toxin-antitoxin system YafQ family toxin n=1 Tax=Fusobacterium nucleatum subsp. polymorphum TaxID=76857 RepID=UPI003009008D
MTNKKTKYTVKMTNKFKKDYKIIEKQGKNIKKLVEVIEMLAKGKQLDSKYKDHSLIGNYKGYRECHIFPDWILIYKHEEDILVLILARTGSHSELF